MAYQSKTYSLSDEVVAAIEHAKAQGQSPNQLLRRALLDADGKLIQRLRPKAQRNGTSKTRGGK